MVSPLLHSHYVNSYLKFWFKHPRLRYRGGFSVIDSHIAPCRGLPHLHFGHCSTVVSLIYADLLNENVFRKLDLYTGVHGVYVKLGGGRIGMLQEWLILK